MASSEQSFLKTLTSRTQSQLSSHSCVAYLEVPVWNGTRPTKIM